MTRDIITECAKHYVHKECRRVGVEPTPFEKLDPRSQEAFKRQVRIIKEFLEQNAWRPISDEAKSGDDMLCYFAPDASRGIHNPRTVTARWAGHNLKEWRCVNTGHSIGEQPTHFMPLPKPPTDKE